MPALTAATVRKKGIVVDEMRARKNLDDILSFFKSNAPRMMLGDPAVGGEALTTGYSQIALAAEGHPLDTVTATMTHWLLARQMPDGRWLGNGLNRPPSEYSTISHTAIAAGGLQSYSIPGRRNEVTASLQRARDWLLAAEPTSAEERGMRLMGWVDRCLRLAWRPPSRFAIDGAGGSWSIRPHRAGAWRRAPSTPCVAGVRRPTQRARRASRFARHAVSGRFQRRTPSSAAVFESGFFGRHRSLRPDELGVVGRPFGRRRISGRRSGRESRVSARFLSRAPARR